jgi:signal transduction histidine kinase
MWSACSRSPIELLDRLGRLLDEMLDVSRIEAGRTELVLEHIELYGLVRDELERLASDLARAGCELELRVQGPTPLVGVWDRRKLSHAVGNLVANAIKFGAGKPIEVTVGALAGIARIEVRDHGIGIAPDRIPILFERFERGVSSREYGGLGLGLYVVKQNIEALGGRVRVESELGAGSTFIVELPRAVAQR